MSTVTSLEKSEHFDVELIRERLIRNGYGIEKALFLIEELCEAAVKRALEEQAQEIWEYLEAGDPEIGDTYRTTDTARRRITKVLEPLRPRCKAVNVFNSQTIHCTSVMGHDYWSGAKHSHITAEGLEITWAAS